MKSKMLYGNRRIRLHENVYTVDLIGFSPHVISADHGNRSLLDKLYCDHIQHQFCFICLAPQRQDRRKQSAVGHTGFLWRVFQPWSSWTVWNAKASCICIFIRVFSHCCLLMTSWYVAITWHMSTIITCAIFTICSIDVTHVCWKAKLAWLAWFPGNASSRSHTWLVCIWFCSSVQNWMETL